MARKLKRRTDCPISTALDLFGDKWTLLVIRDLMFEGKASYVELLRSGEGIATNILADRLALLEGAGVVRSIENERDRRRKLYSLTPKGIDLLPLLVEMVMWSARHDPDTSAHREFVERATADKPGLIAQIRARLELAMHERSSSCATPAGTASTRSPGP